MRRGGRRSAAAGLVAGLVLGCAYSLVDDRGLRGDAFETLVRQVELARGIRAERPIDARVRDRSEMAEVVEAAILGAIPRERIDAYGAGLRTVGLWPAGRDLVDEYASVMGDELAGLYVPSDRALYVVSDAPSPVGLRVASALAGRDFVAEFVLSHELVHLLQHQRYPELFEADALLFEHDDLAIAVQAAFEGDALYFGTAALGVASPDPDAFAVLPEGERLAAAPALIRRLVGFPYAGGYRLAAVEGVALLEDPPASSEQVIHPDRRRDAFQVFALDAVASALPPDCEAVSENTVGELQLSILFGDLASASVEASVWEGWDGDRYWAGRCADAPVLLWVTAWDSGGDAAEFAAAYLAIGDAVAARAGMRSPLRVRRSGREVVVSSEALAGVVEVLDDLLERGRVRSFGQLRDFAEGR